MQKDTQIKKTRFVVFFEGRCGSSYLISLLNNHPQIKAYPEILVDKSHIRQVLKTRFIFSRLNYRGIDKEAVGFKTKLRDIKNPDKYRVVLNKQNVFVIYLYRKNVIKRTLSSLSAKIIYDKYGKWNVNRADERITSLGVDIREFDNTLKEFAQRDRMLEDFISSLQLLKIMIAYEDLFMHRDATLIKLFDFLGVKTNINYENIDSDIVKNTPDNIEEIVTNHHELFDYYRGTAYEHWFYDEQVK